MQRQPSSNRLECVMRPTLRFLLSTFLLSAGCQHISLRNHTERQASTLPALQYDQVLDNIAMFIANPDALPFFSTAGQGQTSNNYQINPSGGLQLGPVTLGSALPFFGLSQVSLGLAETAAENEQWSTNSVLNPDILALMRCVYRKTVGKCACDLNAEQNLQAFFSGHPEFLEAMRPGWYGVGSHHDVPKGALCVRHCNKTYVWVTSEGIDYLTRLTLAILDLATVATPLVIPDPAGTGIDLAKYTELVSMAKDLSQILSQSLINSQPPPLPTAAPGAGNTNTVMPGFVAIQNDLNLIMLALSGIIDQKTPSEVVGKGSLHTFTYMYPVRDKGTGGIRFEKKSEQIEVTSEMSGA